MATPDTARSQNTRLGILALVGSCAVFAVQDAVTRHLGDSVNVFTVVTIRFWAFAIFAVAMSARRPGGLRATAATAFPLIQILRGLLLIAEVCAMFVAFLHLGLINTHAIFISYPLITVALSGPVLGEKVGWRRWLAVAAGFLGVLIILQPGAGVFERWALLPLVAALLFTLYALLTRLVSSHDSAGTSFLWTGVMGALAITPLGLIFWQDMAATEWGFMGLLILFTLAGHGLLIRAYDLAEASAIQPFAYFTLPFSAIVAMIAFGETLRPNVLVGALVVLGAGLFAFWRQRVREREGTAAGN